jgi:hypothetical protein
MLRYALHRRVFSGDAGGSLEPDDCEVGWYWSGEAANIDPNSTLRMAENTPEYGQLS